MHLDQGHIMKIKRFILLSIALLFSSILKADNGSTLLSLAENQGFFFFYRSDCKHCQHFAPTLKRVSHRFGFSVVAISIDGGELSNFPDAVMNQGQAHAFQVSVLPSLFLVNPRTQKAALVSEGDIGEQELLNRLLKVSEMQQQEGAA